MSMTREEAIKYAESKKMMLESLIYNDDCKYGNYAMYSTELSFVNAVISALRPVSRERVEQVWRGCEYCSGDVDNRPYLDSKRLYLDGNGILTDEIENIDILRLDFCPICGKPLTDKAVQMAMERLEALNEED